MGKPLRVVILGGGTAGWMTAAALAALVPAAARTIRLIESEEIGTVGVGEATLPQMRAFNEAIGLIEVDMMRRTAATFKLGIEFVGWGDQHSRYVHPFGAHGRPVGGIGFHHQWLRAVAEGIDAGAIEDYSLAIAAARAGRFDYPDPDKRSIGSTFDYAYHFDAGLYAQHLRRAAEARDVRRSEGRIVDVVLDSVRGTIAAVKLASGEQIDGDLFVDCTGFRALAIGGALGRRYEHWSHWLPCDRAYAVPTARLPTLPPMTRATARAFGWQWRIPLQHRTGNGLIYSSAFSTDEQALDLLMANLPTQPVGEPRALRFSPGLRREGWYRNCVAIGLSSGFLEPLESTSIYLIQQAAMNLVALFPRRADDAALAAEFNRRMDLEYDRIRDFLILHYHANRRSDGEMWRHCRDMAVPDTLAEKLSLFRHRGYLPRYREGLFSPPSWLSVFLGQGEVPRAFHPLADQLAPDRLQKILATMRAEVADAVVAMPAHDEVIADSCAARLEDA